MKNNRIGLIAILAATLTMVGCGSGTSTEMAMDSTTSEYASSGSYSEGSEATKDYIASSEIAMEEADAGVRSEVSLTGAQSTDRKLIRTVDMSLETKEFDNLIDSLNSQITELGGYVERSSVDGNSYYSDYSRRYASMVVRIPADKLDEYVKNVKEESNVISISDSTEDVTLNYVDVESHKKELEIEQANLQTMLEAATTVEDMITIQTRLSEVRYELETYTSQLRVYDNQVDYATVNISVQEVERENIAPEQGFWSRVAIKFSDSLYSIQTMAVSFAIELLGNLPYIIILGVIIAIVVIIIVQKNKKMLKKRQQSASQEQNKTDKNEENT